MVEKPLWLWIIFYIFVGSLLIFDLGIVHRKSRQIKFKESIILSLIYIFIGLLFGLFVLYFLDKQSAVEYYTGFFLEKTLAIDNIFLILMIFTSLKIKEEYQYKILFYGILGVIIMRFIIITLGVAFVVKFEWILYIFGAILIIMGVKMLISKHDCYNPINSGKLMNFIRKIIPQTDEIHGDKFFIKKIDEKTQKSKILATPLFIALIFVEFADLVCTIDSLPAIFAVTQNKYVIYTSNIFAILGLRALYFVVSGLYYRFKYLKYALALTLIFIGSKIFIIKILGIEHFPSEISLLIVSIIITSGILFSFYKSKNEKSDINICSNKH